MNNLLQLVHQYKGDVEQQIRCIKNDWENADTALALCEDAIDDYKDQITHWEATLKQIDKVLAEYETKKSVDIIASGYEWICPDCNNLNYEIEVIEKVTCAGCGHIFETNPPEHAYKN